MRNIIASSAPVVLLSLLPLLAFGEPTRELGLRGPKEITEGDPETASIDAQGQITMGPKVVELARISAHPVVSLLPGSGGTIYAGTAGGGVIRVTAGGAKRTVTKADSSIVSALAMFRGKLHMASNPDGPILAVDRNAKKRTFFKPKSKYVWAMLGRSNDLLLATGEPGQVVSVSASAKPRVLFDPNETHIRALIRHPRRGLIAGGGQKGIVYQVKGSTPFALYDSEMEEVTSFAIDPRNGDLFAAFVSETEVGTLVPKKAIGPVKGDPEAADATSPIKGSEVVRIAMSGQVDLLWTSKGEGALSLAFDPKTRLLYIATGTKRKGRGRIYAVDSKNRDRVLLIARVEPPIASVVMMAPTGGALIVGTSPAGTVSRIGPGLRAESTYVSKEQDLERISAIGRIWFDADVPPKASVEVAVRSGNTKEHDKTWSAWSAPVRSTEGGDIKVPQGRYAQIRARLRASPKGAAPVVKSLHASVMRRNIAPSVGEVFLLRRGVYMAAMPREEEKEKTVTLSETTIKGLREPPEKKSETRVRQGIKPGMLTLSWTATDENKDSLLYRVELRRLDDSDRKWRLLQDNIREAFFTIDSQAYPDGRYQARVTASDRPSNPPDQSLSDRNTSEPFVVDNAPPQIKNLKASSPASRLLRIEADAEDETSSIDSADFSVSGGPWLMLPAKDGLIDARKETLVVDVASSDTPGSPAVKRGKHTVLIRVEDEAGNSATASTNVLVK